MSLCRPRGCMQVYYPACNKVPVAQVAGSPDEYATSEQTIAESMARATATIEVGEDGSLGVVPKDLDRQQIERTAFVANEDVIGVDTARGGEAEGSPGRDPGASQKRILKLAVSEYGRLYFACLIDGKGGGEVGDDGRGILVVQVEEALCTLYDGKGRVSGKPKALTVDQVQPRAPLNRALIGCAHKVFLVPTKGARGRKFQVLSRFYFSNT